MRSSKRSSNARSMATPKRTRSLMRPLARSLGRHAQRAVETDGLAVEHRVLRDVTDERRELVGPAEPRRERHLLPEGGARSLGEPRQHRGIEDAWSDGAHADAHAGQLAR